MLLVCILGPVGSGRDRKNEEKASKCGSNLVFVETIKKESGFKYQKYTVIVYYY